MRSPGFTVEHAEAALLGGVRISLTEWLDLDAKCRETFTEAGSKLLQSSLMTLSVALSSREAALEVFNALRSAEDRVKDIVLSNALRAASAASSGEE